VARQEVLEMSPKNNKSKNFVGRESELKELQKLLKKPYGKVRILFLLGDGGIGKTKLLEEMLKQIPSSVLSIEKPLDLSATEHRSIDGIQMKIVEIIENLTRKTGGNSPFKEFRKENQDTSEQFNRCLREFCRKKPLVLAFDTFEVLDTVASNWLFADGGEGLQVPGLMCIIAGRPNKEGLEKYLENLLVKKIEISGLSFSNTEIFYRKHKIDVGSKDAMDFWAERDREDKVVVPETLKFIWDITKGHPLRIEMALNWANLGDISPAGITAETFENKMMDYVCESGDRGYLKIGVMEVGHAAFDALACMGVVTRRFDEDLLKYLIEFGYIRFDIKKHDIKEILEPLEKYFFVKTRVGNRGEQVYQLHDEMARLVQRHVWSYRDQSGSGMERKALLEAVLLYYEQWLVKMDKMIKEKGAKIERAKNEVQKRDLQNAKIKDEVHKKDIQIERLYYAFKLDALSDPIGDGGRRLWFELVNIDDDYINSYLPAEIKKYKAFYDPAIQYEIYSRIAQLEFDAGHITQARGEWLRVHKLGLVEKKNAWVASALFGIANCEKEASVALKKFKQAKRFCEKYAPDYLPSVNYNIGFSYRKMQDVEKAIEWYKIAWREYQKNSKDKALGAKIVNDLGYAYSHKGEWELCQRHIDEGQAIRDNIKLQLEQEVAILDARLKSKKLTKESQTELQDQLARKRKELSKARIQLGLSHNTLGEIYRYQEKLGMSLVNYRIALTQFEMSKAEKWQAKALFSRGETYRRMAWEKYRKGDEVGYKENTEKAEKDVRESLYICKKYRIKDERDTANRRIGRIFHDRAIRAKEKGKYIEAQQLLEKARNYFVEGLQYAKDTGDDLETLSNQTELAFIYDDFVHVVGANNVPSEYKNSLRDLRRLLKEHGKKTSRIYQFTVFKNEYKLEEAATAYQNGRYELALKKYIEGIVGLAADPGYGRTRYKLLFHHLTGQIEKLAKRAPKEAKKWCHAFINTWEAPQVIDENKIVLKHESIFPDMLEWCWKLISKIDEGRL